MVRRMHGSRLFYLHFHVNSAYLAQSATRDSPHIAFTAKTLLLFILTFSAGMRLWADNPKEF